MVSYLSEIFPISNHRLFIHLLSDVFLSLGLIQTKTKLVDHLLWEKVREFWLIHSVYEEIYLYSM